MHKVPVAVRTLFFIALSCIEDFSMGQHGSSLVWNIEDISVALQTLIVLERGISLLTILLVVIFILDKGRGDGSPYNLQRTLERY